MKLLHLLVDDKFVDMAIREFEAVAPGQHDWVVLGGRKPFKHVKDARVRCLDQEAFSRAVICSNVRGVICHVMTPAHLGALAAVPVDTQVVWIGWGYDYYGLLNDAFSDGLLLPETALLAARLAAPAPDAAARAPVPTVLSHARPYRRPGMRELGALARVDIFSPVIDTEYHLVRRHASGFGARYLRWNYGTAEDDFMLPCGLPSTPGRNLLVGNSATLTNNHVELFDRIRRHADIDGRMVVVPLSYGDPTYRDYILKAGKALFGAAFVPLVDFMPKDRYIELLGSCGHVMMNHVRQQGLGNLVISGLLGAKLHLNRRNPLYRWLGSQGIAVSDVERPDFAPLSPASCDEQVSALQLGFGRDVQRARTRALVDAALAPRLAPHGVPISSD